MAKDKRNATRKETSTKKKTYRFDSKSMLKTVIMGPSIAALATIAVYCAWWACSSLFYSLHSWTTESFVPWMKANWVILLIIWAIIIISSVVYFIFEENKRKMPRNDLPKKTKNENNLEDSVPVKEEIFTIKDVEKLIDSSEI